MRNTDIATLQQVKAQINETVLRTVTVAFALAGVGGIVLVIGLALLATNQPPELRHVRMGTGFAVAVAALVSSLILKRWGPRPAIIFFSLCGYSAVSALSVLAETGVASPGTAVGLTLVVIASFMVGPSAGKWTTWGAIAGIVALTALQYTGAITGLTPRNTPPAFTYAVAYVIVFAMAGAVIHRFSTLFWGAMDQVDRARQTLEAKVHQQLQTQARLQDSELRLTALLDNTPMGILIFRLEDGRLHYANQHALKEHGVDNVDELEGCIISDYPYTKAEIVKAIQDTCELGPQQIHWLSYTGDKRELWWSVKTDLLMLDGKQFAAAFATDITFQIQTQQALIDEQFRLEEKVKERTAELFEQQRQLNAIIDALPVSLSIKDVDGRYLMCNKVFEAMWGKAKAEILDKSDNEIFDFATAYTLGHDDAALLAENQSARYEQDMPAIAGGANDYLVTKVPLLDEHHEVQALLTVATDISDIKALQRAFSDAKNEAERLTKVKSEFLANMSHEIRTPLNAVLGLAQIGEREHMSSASASALFNKINKSGHHLLGVINDILDFSKIDAGKLNIESHCLSPLQVADEARAVLFERAVAKNLSLKVDNQGVPDWVSGDSLRIQQILINLLSNAIKFTHEGGITLTLQQRDQQLVFTVKDTGIGMPPQTLARVFSPFEQADTSTTRKFGGTGLGLSISRQLARLMGGDITASSTLGVGSAFVLTLPLVISEQTAHVNERATHAPLIDCPLRGMRVLVADDVEVNREILLNLLEHEGADAMSASNGKEAVDLVARLGAGYFDIVLMDVQMPVMDGLAACEHIRHVDPGLPVVALTAHAMPEERQRCMDAGMVAHLAKPIETVRMVNTILNKARQPTHPRAAEADRGQVKVAAATPAASPAGLRPELACADLEAALKRCGGKEKVLVKLLSKFADSMRDFMDRFAELLDQDQDQARRMAHTLKGTAANLGFTALSNCASELEVACTQGVADDIAQTRAALAHLLPTTLSALDNWLEQQEEAAGIAYNAA